MPTMPARFRALRPIQELKHETPSALTADEREKVEWYRHDAIRSSQRVRRLRRLAYALRGPWCQECEEMFEFASLELHHANVFSYGRETLDDVVLLCGVCHRAVHPSASPALLH